MIYERAPTKNEFTGLIPSVRPNVSPRFIRRSQMYQLQRNIGNFTMQAKLDTDDHDMQLESGLALPTYLRDFFEPRLGSNLGRVRVHTGPAAAESARALNAKAYTFGRDIVFGDRQYAPHSAKGRRLLVHELAHTIQQSQDAHRQSHGGSTQQRCEPVGRQHSPKPMQGENAGAVFGTSKRAKLRRTQPVIQRELLAYKREHMEMMPTAAMPALGSPPITYQVYSADAPAVRQALEALITAHSVGLRENDEQAVFFDSGVGRTDLVAAFTAAGFSRASEMTDALLDRHNLYVYSNERVTRMTQIFTTELGRATEVLEQQVERPLTDYEQSEARLVFGDSLDFDRFAVAEDAVMTVGGYARTTPHEIYFPPGSFGSSNFMSWLIHELTHIWQYQHGYSIFTLIYHALEADYDYGGEAGLIAANTAGRSFTDFTTEEQGDILSDYYDRLKAGQNVDAWLPFAQQVRNA